MESSMEFPASNPENLPAEPIENDNGQIAAAASLEEMNSNEDHGALFQNSESPADNSSNNDALESVDEENEPETTHPSCIKFWKKGYDNSQLVVKIEPSEDYPAGIPLDCIQSWIREQGCDSWLQDEDVILQFSQEARRLKEPKEYILAERKDCFIDVRVSRDRLKAWVTVSKSYGGEPFSEEHLKNVFEAEHIKFGIKENVLQDILREKWCDEILIAEGKLPVEGTDVKFEPLVRESDHKGIPQERENGTVDYKDLGLFLSVAPGTPLLRHIPPVQGTPGTGVDGEVVPALLIKDRPAHAGIGTAISPDDPDIVIATRAGEPFFEGNSVRVDPTLEIDQVDPSTGNVSFEGNIIINGTVDAGYKVHAGQSLTILDTVEGADLTAGKDLTLVTGVFGRGKSKIRVQRNLEARFLSDCKIECGGNIEVTDLMSHCFVECEGSLRLGQLGGKGQIIGGEIHVQQKVQAQIIGSASEINTRIEVRPSDVLLSRMERIKEEIKQAEQKLKTVEKSIQSLTLNKVSDDNQRLRELTATKADLKENLDILDDEKTELMKKLDSSQKGSIRAEQVYRGAELSVGKAHQSISGPTRDFCLTTPPEEIPQPEPGN